ncbi:MAG: hypothetical protein JNK48_13745 [Bryobacterales bacterium]|nr:hypothetical protein [Bryobacterales bacterium]
MNILFLALSSAGYGETIIGLSLARSLRDQGHKAHFIIDCISSGLFSGGEFPHTVLEPQMGPMITLVMDSVIAEFKPEVIVLADYFTYCGVFSKRYKVDPWFIEQYGIPIVPVDIWEWHESEFAIDVFLNKKMPVSRKILDMGTALRPVPLCRLSSRRQDVFPFSLQAGAAPVSSRTREHLRTALGVPKHAKLVMLASAKWQMPTLSDDNGNRLAEAVPALLAHYLELLPDSVHFVNVGERPAALSQLPQDRLHLIPSCAQTRFNVLLGSVDLFVTLNLGATTLTRAVMTGVQGLVIENSIAGVGPEDLQRIDGTLRLDDFAREWLARTMPVYPFRMWPLGFHDFLQPMLTDNPYLDTFARTQLLDGEGIRTMMERMLFDRGTIDRYKDSQQRYAGLVSALDDGASCFMRAMECLGLGRRYSR